MVFLQHSEALKKKKKNNNILHFDYGPVASSLLLPIHLSGSQTEEG